MWTFKFANKEEDDKAQRKMGIGGVVRDREKRVKRAKLELGLGLRRSMRLGPFAMLSILDRTVQQNKLDEAN